MTHIQRSARHKSRRRAERKALRRASTGSELVLVRAGEEAVIAEQMGVLRACELT
jgi:hypothetical protein